MAGINHVDVKASGEKGYAAEWNKDHQQKGNHDCEQFQFQNQVIENAVAFPGGPVEGQIIYRTDLFAMYIYDGTGWSRSNLRVLYWSCPGIAFLPAESGHTYDDDEEGVMDENTGGFNIAPVELPHKATVTAVVVNGSNFGAGGGTPWSLFRRTRTAAAGKAEMAGANEDVEDVTITNPIIDNETYVYWLQVETTATTVIEGARITYTL